jgi:hypothetical protein
MTPARSLAASVAALGFASAMTAPLPAYAAPAPCTRAGRFAAQAEAEAFRIERLDLQGATKRAHGEGVARRDSGERPSVEASESAGEVLEQLDQVEPDPARSDGEDESGKDESGEDESGQDADGVAVDESDESASPEPTADEGFTPAAFRAPSTTSGGRDAEPASSAGSDAKAAGGGGDAKPAGGGGDVGSGGSKTVVSGVGIGDSRSVMIADAPVKSAAAGLVLNGRVAGAPAAEQVLQQAPPSHAKAAEQRTGLKKFGPIQVGAGEMSAHARWDTAMGCGAAAGEISRSATRLDRVAVGGELIRVPDMISSLSSTALSRTGGSARSVASVSVSAGRIELAGGDVKIRVLRAPTLRVSMSATEGGEVRYQPAVVEVSGPGLSRTRLDTSSDRIDVTVSDVGPLTESVPAPVLPSHGSPLPSIPGLPVPSGSPSTGGAGGGAPLLENATAGKAVVRVSLGDVRQASKGNALAARATAIKVAVLRVSRANRGRSGYGSSAVVADLGVGVLEAAAVAPEPGRRSVEAGSPAAAGSLPVTGPRVAPMVITGVGLLAGGVCAFLMGARRRRHSS